MKIRLYQVDAFASRVFEGNPAAVCPLDDWPEDSVLQAMAEENNLSETAFFVPSAKGYQLRWFTPVREVDLCGHATLATAHIIFDEFGYTGTDITFETRSGALFVRRDGRLLQMDFPTCPPKPCEPIKLLAEGLGRQPVEMLEADDYLAIFESEEDILSIKPDHALLSRLGLRGVIVSAPGKDLDFVSRFFLLRSTGYRRIRSPVPHTAR